jgi:hypothetical protein
MFTCPLAEFVWAFTSEALRWDGYPGSMDELLSEWLTGKLGANYQTSLSCFAGLAWAIWTTRNKIAIRKNFPDKPFDIVYLGISFIQKWKFLMKKGVKVNVEEMTKVMMQFARGFKQLESNPYDVGFI